MERILSGKYSKEFREEVIKLVIEGGLSVPEAGRRLSLSPSTLRNRVIAHKEGKLSEVGSTRRQLTETELEMARLRRELAEVKMERDILKKAAAYFAKESQRGTR
ncbi:MAG: transposase [Thermodesulfobacteriota bacterium]